MAPPELREHPVWYTHLAQLARSLGAGLRDLVYPGTCLLCTKPIEGDPLPFCETCRMAVTTDEHARCARCAATIGAFVPGDSGCTHCRHEVFAFERVLRLGPYEGLLRNAVLRMKHPSGEMLAECLGLLWARARTRELQEAAAQVVIPVPLHWWRRWTRTYNQSAALAYALAGILRIPCRPGWLRRARSTVPQTQLTPAQRRENLRKVFRASGDLRGKSVLLVDDVLTTGSTASEAAAALRKQGAGRVVVAVLARSLT